MFYTTAREVNLCQLTVLLVVVRANIKHPEFKSSTRQFLPTGIVYFKIRMLFIFPLTETFWANYAAYTE